MKRFIRLIVLVAIFGAILWFAKSDLPVFAHNRVDAVGAVTIDLGVPDGDPIFTFSNLQPGDSKSHTVTVNNGDTVGRVIGIKGEMTNGVGGLENAMDVVISQNGSPVYGAGSSTGEKTLADFFSESTTINGVSLTTVPANSSTSYVITVTFRADATNQYQNTDIQFDLHFGIVSDVPLACEGMKFAHIIDGTAGNDRLTGTNGNDLIWGYEGNNVIDGGNGNDCIVVGDGNNRIQGGNGNDVIVAGNGNNTIDAGNGNDIVSITGGGNNSIKGGNDNDSITGGSGSDIIHGDNGNDVIHGGDGNDRLFGDNGSDQLYGDTGTDTVNGGNGNDTCIGSQKVLCEQ